MAKPKKGWLWNKVNKRVNKSTRPLSRIARKKRSKRKRRKK